MRRALIVDDDAFIAGIYAAKMEQAGYAVQVASSVRDAVHKAELAPPDVIMLDVVLGTSSGLDALSYLRQTNGCETTPVVIVSNQDDPSLIQEATRRGASSYLVKSYYTPSEIVSRVRALSQ